MKRLFEDPDRIIKLPRLIALAVQEMLVEIDVSGEHTTADETVNLIEEVFSKNPTKYGLITQYFSF